MSALEQDLHGYLAVRRALGYKLARTEKLLTQFLAWLDERGEDVITIELALEWATLPPATDSNWHRHRLTVVRAFAAHMHAIDSRHEVPPADLLVWRKRRAVPYLYSDAEVRALMAAASIIPTPHRAATMRTVIGLWPSRACASGKRSGSTAPTSTAATGCCCSRQQVRQVARTGRRSLDDRGIAALAGSPRPSRPGRTDRGAAHLETVRPSVCEAGAGWWC